jgi:hypothetical protein
VLILLCIREFPCFNFSPKTSYSNWDSRGVSSTPPGKCWIVHQIRSWLNSSIHFLIYYAWIVKTFDIVCSELCAVSCSISIGAAKKAVSNWLNRKHTKQWESIIGLKQAKELIPGPSAKRTRDLLKLNRDQLRWIVGLYTGHCHLKGHLIKMGLMNDPICEVPRSRWISHTGPMWLWGFSLSKISPPGIVFMEPGDFYDVPIGKVLHFIRTVGLTKG